MPCAGLFKDPVARGYNRGKQSNAEKRRSVDCPDGSMKDPQLPQALPHERMTERIPLELLKLRALRSSCCLWDNAADTATAASATPATHASVICQKETDRRGWRKAWQITAAPTPKDCVGWEGEEWTKRASHTAAHTAAHKHGPWQIQIRNRAAIFWPSHGCPLLHSAGAQHPPPCLEVWG